MPEAFLLGVAAGYAIAIPIGPIAVLILRTGVMRGFAAAAAAGAGAATADLVYATVAMWAAGSYLMTSAVVWALNLRAAEGRASVVRRFSATERAFHWSIALPTLVLLLSGLFLRFGWLQALMVGYDHRVGLRLHLLACVTILFLPLLMVLRGDRRVLRRTGRALVQMDSADLRFLRDLPRWLRSDPDVGREVGRFNGGQKLNTLVSGFTLLVATATGLFLWIFSSPPAGATAPRSLLGAWAGVLHEATTYILLPVLAGHIFMALVHPRTRESFRGMLFGFVDAGWASRHHPRWDPEAAGESRDPERAG